MDQDDRTEGLGATPDRDEPRIIEIDTVDVARDLHTRESGHRHDVVEFRHCGRRVLHRDRADCRESIRVQLDGFGKAIVLERASSWPSPASVQ